jgi:hypothetical protein
MKRLTGYGAPSTPGLFRRVRREASTGNWGNILVASIKRARRRAVVPEPGYCAIAAGTPVAVPSKLPQEQMKQRNIQHIVLEPPGFQPRGVV